VSPVELADKREGRRGGGGEEPNHLSSRKPFPPLII
jgi:hypothetical protein